MKRVVAVCTRFTGRPLLREFKVNTLKRNWLDSGADLHLAVHGPGTIGIGENECYLSPQVSNVTNYNPFTGAYGWAFPPFTWSILTSWLDYAKCPEFIILMDDDCYFLDPVEAVDQLVGYMDADPKLGAVGPIGSYRKFKRTQTGWYHGGMNELVQSPWATLGAQMYRTSALRELDLNFLLELKFRMDVPLFMLLYGKGYTVGEVDVRFQHVVSGGLDRMTKTTQFYKDRMAATAHDYEIMAREIRSQVSDAERLDVIMKGLRKVELSEAKHSRRKLAKLQLELLEGVQE